jgi:hypothetical protein
MADPRLQLRRGTQSPSTANVTTALAGEPFFDTTNDNLWVADGAATFVHIGGASYTTRVDAFLTLATTTIGAQVVLKEGTTNGTDAVTIKSPNSLAASYTLTLPANDGDASQFLQTDGSGALSWATVVSSFNLAGDTGTDSFSTGATLTFAGTDPIDTVVSNDTVTISAKDATTTTKGVASFSATDFSVTSGAVSINAESIQDTVGAMVSTNTENGIAVTYDDTNGKLDFDVADFTLTLGGDLSGSATITNLASATLTATIAANSVALGTDTTGQYASTITGGVGIAATATGADDGTAYTIDLDINELTAETAVVDADTFAFYDASVTANRKVTAANLAIYVLAEATGDVTFANGVATIAANSVALGTDTTGNYVGDVTAGAGLTKTSVASEGQTVNLAIGAGEGITINADDVALKNGTNLANATVMAWDNTNNQLTNAPITYSGNDVAVTGDLTVTGNDIKSSGGTTAISLSGANVTIAGDLTVSGATTTLNTATLKVEDRIIELGLIDGAAPIAATTWDTAVAFNYFATTAKKSAIVWIDNAGFELAATLTESAGAAGSDPQIAVDTRASLGIASLFIGSIGTSTNEVITASKTVVNVTIDCGTY